MSNQIKIAAILALIVGGVAYPALGQKKIQTIRVERIVSAYPNEQDHADVITAKIISHLVKAGASVVEGASDADTDAVLKVTYTERGNEDTGFHIEGPVRLTAIDGKIVWADEVRTRMFTRNASDNFAEIIAAKVAAFLAAQK